MPTAREEEYLEAIFKLQEEAERPVNISRVAEHLGLSVASASEMIKKLKENNLVEIKGTRRIILTNKGTKQASQVIRRHRLAERLLTDYLHISWDQVHDEACKLEHAISPIVEESLEKSLGNPMTCPHGYPIPDKNGNFSKIKLRSINRLKKGEKGVVTRVVEDKPDVLNYLAGLGLIPSKKFEVVEIAPFKGPITLKVDGKEIAIGYELSEMILVEAAK